MSRYPAAGDVTGFSYTQQRRLPFAAYNNAKAAGFLTVALATSTTVSNADIRSGDVVILFPKNAKAATVLAGGTNVTAGIYVSAVADGSFTVTHNNHSAAAGSIFHYAVFRNF